MADDGEDETTGSSGSPETNQELKNIKAEFSRKHNDVTKMLADQNTKMEAVINALVAQQQRVTAPAIAAQEAELDDLILTNPKEYARRVKSEAAKAAQDIVDASDSKRAATIAAESAIVNQLIGDYPELNDRSSELYAKTISLHNSMTAAEKASPVSMKIAARDAAAELGIVPLRNRRQAEEYIGSGDGGSNGAQGSRGTSRNTGKKKLDPRTLQFAELLGMKTEDPKVVAALEKRAERKNWNRYST